LIPDTLFKAKNKIKGFMREYDCPLTLEKVQQRIYRLASLEELFNIMEDMAKSDAFVSKTIADSGETIYFYTYKKKRAFKKTEEEEKEWN